MQNSVLLVAGLCPICKTRLEYEDTATAVFCPRCGSASAVGTLLPQNSERLPKNAFESTPGGGEDALVFFDRFYKSYHWDKFAVSEELTVAELDLYSADCIKLFPTDPLSYVFNFRRIAIPLMKKIEGLDILEFMIAETRRKLDVEGQRTLFDKYRSIISRISSRCKLITEELRESASEAKRYGASEEIVDDLFASLNTVEQRISKLEVPHHVTDVAKAKAMYDGANNVILAEASALGVDVNEIYDSARAALDEGDIDSALHKLLTIRGFKDSAEIIDEYSRLNTPCNSIINIGKKTYYLEKRTYLQSESFSLYEISDGVLGSLVLDGISSVIAVFGTKLFFIRGNCKLCCFLSEESDVSKNVIIIDSAEGADFKIPSAEDKIFLSDRTGFIVEKKLRSERKRWFLVRLILWIIRLVRRKKKAKINRKNNYSTLLVDMDSCVAKTVVPEAVDVMDIIDDKIFYLSAHNDDSAPSVAYKDVNTDECADILGINHGILGAEDGLIIYSEFTHGDCGFSIYSKDAKAPEVDGAAGDESAAIVKAPTLLAENANEFLGLHDGIILYSVGSEAEKRLYSVKVSGGAPMELSSGYDKLICTNDGFAYYTVGDGVNTCLYRSALHGYSRSFIVCGFAELYKIGDGNILYRDTEGYLCSVSTSSLGKRRIVSGVLGENIIDCGEVIYLIKSERGKDGEEYSSLYSVAPDGSELKKLIHGACSLYEFDSENLLAASYVTKDYLIKTPISKKDYSTERQCRKVVVYTLVRKQSAERRKLLTLGEPVPGFATYTTRFLLFFKRRRTKATVIIPLYQNTMLSKRHMLDEGAVMAEEQQLKAEMLREKMEKKQRRKAEKRDKKLRKKQAKEEKRLAEEQRLLGL